MSILARNLKTGLEGFKKLVNDLESTPKDKREKILEAIKAEDPTWHERIVKSLLGFNEIFFNKKDVYMLQKILDAMTPLEYKILVMSIFGDADLKQIVMDNLSPQVQQDFLEVLKDTMDVTPGQKYMAQLKFIAFARKIAEKNAFKLKEYEYDPNATIAKPKYEDEEEKERVTSIGILLDETPKEEPEYMKVPFISVDQTIPSIPNRLISRVKSMTMVFDVMSIGPGGIMITTENPQAVNIPKGEVMIVTIEPKGKFTQCLEVKCITSEKRTTTNPANGNTNYLFKLSYNDVLSKNTLKELNDMWKLVFDERPKLAKTG